MENLTINDLKRGQVYTIDSKTDKYICLFDRLIYCLEREQYLIFDFFCISGKRGLLCNTQPLTLSPIYIREANDEEIYALFSTVRAELLQKKQIDDENIGYVSFKG